MILPFTIIPIDKKELNNKSTDEKAEFFKDIIYFWHWWGSFFTTAELKHYIQEEIRGLSLRLFSSSERYTNTLELLHDRSKVIEPFNSDTVWESMKKGTKDLQVVFHGWDDVFIKRKSIVEKRNRRDFMKGETQKILLPDKALLRPCDSKIFKDLEDRWIPWLTYVQPEEKGSNLRIVIYDPYLTPDPTYPKQDKELPEYFEWLLDLINKKCQFDVELEIFCKQMISKYQKKIVDLLSSFPRIRSATLYCNSSRYKRGNRYIRIEDSCITYDHPPDKSSKDYQETFTRLHWTDKSSVPNALYTCHDYEKRWKNSIIKPIRLKSD
ncbi:MAG: hypothetical protein ACKN9J_04025 [Holophagaceae bacterium]